MFIKNEHQDKHENMLDVEAAEINIFLLKMGCETQHNTLVDIYPNGRRLFLKNGKHLSTLLPIKLMNELEITEKGYIRLNMR